ncbi:MAG: CIA30 family protein [Bacteroidota bacterium]
MQILIFLLMSLLNTSNGTLEIDFGKDKDGQDWRIVNDGVMGGLSKGFGNLDEDAMLFKGEVSLENNGGFSSLRSPYQDFDLSMYEKVVIRLKAKGQILAFTMNVDQRWYKPYFKQQIKVDGDDWQVVELPFSEFETYRIGDQIDYDFSEVDAKKVIRIGLITDSKKAGAFEAEIDYIKFE